MPNWNIQKRNMLDNLLEDQREFYEIEHPKMLKQLQSMLGSVVDSQMVNDMLHNATEIRAILRDWDRTAIN